MGMVRCVRAAIPLLRAAEWARIVNVSAHSTKRQSDEPRRRTPRPRRSSRASRRTSRCLLAKDEILVNTVSPGSFATETLGAGRQSVGIDPDDLYAIMAGIDEHFGHPALLPRAGDPNEIGPVIAFVASRRNSLHDRRQHQRRRRLRLLLTASPHLTASWAAAVSAWRPASRSASVGQPKPSRK